MPDLAHPRSLWLETASPAPPPVALENAVKADIAIIGGGYTGLNAALRAIERGLHPVVLEAVEIGWGASGRNGGVVSTKFRASLSDIAAHHGLEAARRMHRIGHDAMDRVERNIQELGLADAGFIQTGNLRCAHNELAQKRLVAEAETARGMFGDASLTILNASAVREETGSADFVGGVLSTHAGIVHPLNYARGLAGAVRTGGGEIFENSVVVARRKDGDRTVLTTARGQVAARHVLIASNGYSDITAATAPVRGTVIPFRSAMIATEPLGADLRVTLMRHCRSYSETRRMMRWFRPAGDRMLFGGRGAFGREDSASAFQALERALKEMLPQLAGTAITHRWSGLVAMTMDSLPQIGMLDERTGFALGYNGAGIAMSGLMGRRAVDLMLGDRPELGLMQRNEPQSIPFYFLREPAVRTVAGWYQFLDRIGR
ncbi:FAD-binding oxidoreductase [Mesorhizobium sp. B2-4-9]|uniref:NAD(P)/FAD-dependent oxidoreductase n=1 Tax=Mesorhizobium sp. B2-4-9 TaxID=2589940 RepID=UPI00112EF728|nr:FAD-binding oxidoreductase [Mesorhizobium sp. B2-4-9]TPL23513.1 FAD-binding oxidoreductase [Mesorhizobium sp. B2-4-9]